MGFFDFLRPRRARRAAPRARRQTFLRGRGQRYLDRVEDLEARRDRSSSRRRPATEAPQRARSRAASRDDDPTVPIPKSVQRAAELAFQRKQAREQRDQAASQRREAQRAAKLLKQRNRGIQAYMTAGLNREEAEAILDRPIEYDDPRYNPRRARNPGALAIAAGILAARSNRLPPAGSRLQSVRTAAQNPRRRLAAAMPNDELAAIDSFYAQALSRADRAIEDERRAKAAYYSARGPRELAIAGRAYTEAQAARKGALGVLSTQRRHAEQRYETAAAAAERRARPEQGRLFNPRRRRRNPNLAPIVADVAKNVIQGGLIAAVGEELKEWRDQAHKGGPAKIVREHAPRRRRNPARLEPGHADPKLREMSQRFHGTPNRILHLDPEQRRPPPEHVVEIGQERATVYRPHRSSERGGADWEHEAGDQGPLQRKAAGNRILVADRNGQVYVVRGTSRMTFDPDRGLVK